MKVLIPGGNSMDALEHDSSSSLSLYDDDLGEATLESNFRTTFDKLLPPFGRICPVFKNPILAKISIFSGFLCVCVCVSVSTTRRVL